jgi:uncharacterized membrane protein YbhN (UPF0104 family)
MNAASRKSWFWKLLKWLLMAAVLLFIGRRFWLDLQHPDLYQLELRPAWLVASAAIYLVGLLPAALFWHRLLHRFGENPSLWASVRANYIGHLGKYVPGKAWALLLRAAMVRDCGVRAGVSIIASFYEVLTTMGAGSLLAAGVYAFDPPRIPGLDLPPHLTIGLLLAACAVPLLPAVFNRVVGKLAGKFEQLDATGLPPVRLTTLLEGLAITSLTWGFFGLSTWALLAGLLPTPPELTLAFWLECSAAVALAQVAGFLAVMFPSGIGVREYLLRHLLATTGPEALVTVAVLLLRLVWTAAEVVWAAAIFWIKPTNVAEPPGS